MKKNILNKLLLITICPVLMLYIVSLTIYANDAYTTEYASYQETEHIEENDLGYGIKHVKTKAISTANECNNPGGFGLVDSPQVINVLSVPSQEGVRVVNYTYPNESGWTKQTLSKMVQSFELNNPGWTVLAGVNGDFYDINGTNKALPYQTRGTTVSNGDILKAHELRGVGYTNSGTKDSFVFASSMEFSDYHVLTIYDDAENILKEIKVDKLNELPVGDEVAVYYTYRNNVDNDGDGSYDTYSTQYVTVPDTNSYIIDKPKRCLPTNEPELFAKGQITSTNKEVELKFGQFAIVTSNEEIVKLLENNTNVRIQKELLGELAGCDQVLSVGSTLMENGDVSTDNFDGMRKDRHPRTCIGVKEDGTLMFFVIDGRQQEANMYGMTQDEQGAMLAYYGCTWGFNIDGGGSSTLGIRDEYGNFQIMNTPSDNNERAVSNALLVVVPQLTLNKTEITDTSIKLSYNKLAKGISVDNINVTINGVTKEMTSDEFVFDGLTPLTDYTLSYNYDITYNGVTTSVDSEIYQFKTGKVGPNIDYAYYDIIDDEVVLKYQITDINQLATFLCLNYDGNLEFIDNPGIYTKNFDINELSKLEFIIEIDYSVECVPNRNGSIKHNVLWEPTELDKSIYNKEKLEQVEYLIKTVNDELVTLSTDDAITLINNANNEFIRIYNVQLIEEHQIKSINELEEYVASKSYSKKNATKVRQILAQAINDINNATEKSEITNILDDAMLALSEINTKNCSSNSVVIISLLSSLVVVLYTIRRKH